MPTADMATTVMIQGFYQDFCERHEEIDTPIFRLAFLVATYREPTLIAASIALHEEVTYG